MPLLASSDDAAPKVRRIKSKRDLNDVVMDLNEKKSVEGIPDEVMQVLSDMTLGGTEQLHLWEVEKCAQILERVKAACAQHGEKPTYDQCNEGVDLLMLLMQAKNANHPEMVYTHLPQQLQSVFKCWDLDGSGTVSATELHAAAGAWTKMHEEKGLLARLLFGAVILMLVMFVGIFVLGMVTVELSKEFKASSGTMVDNTGRSVRVSSSGYDVSSDGTLQILGPQGKSCTGETCTRRLASDGGSALVSTQKVRKEKALHSALADGYFDALDEITIHSEKGHKLNLKISGFARIPVLGSRCGNVVHLFSVVDGHLTLDSTDLSFSGHLLSLFENAGFELAVGGAAGRRLNGVRTVTGFFNHIQDVKAAGWTCKGVPLPKTPTTSTVRQVRYSPCSSSSSTGKTFREACDSSFGGFLAGVVSMPPQHLDAVSTRLDNVRRSLGALVDSSQVKYSVTKTTVMRSPSYQVQFNMFPNHPKQEQVIVFNKAKKQGLSFQRMVSGSFGRTFCTPTESKDEPSTKLENAEESGVNASLHLEFMGVVSEDGTMYRHWRAMPSDSFRKWMVGESVKPIKEYFEFWDDASTLAPHRILDSTGSLTVFQRSEEGVTDADVEAALGPANDDDAVAVAQGKATSYSFTCGSDETDAFHPVHGMVPHMISPLLDPSKSEFDFYVLQLAEDIDSAANVTEDEDVAEQGAAGTADEVSGGDVSQDDAAPSAAAEAQAAIKLENGTADEISGGDDSQDDAAPSAAAEAQAAKLENAWAAMKTTRVGDSEHDFATYALRSLELFAMPDACADVCKKPLAAAQAAVDQNGVAAFCNTAPAETLLVCLNALQPPLLNSCDQSPFRTNVMKRCTAAEAADRSSESTVDVLADGTHAVELGSLGTKAREQINAGLDVGDKSGARLLLNASSGPQDVVISGAALANQNVPSARRLGLISWCGSVLYPMCWEINFPLRCKGGEDGGCKFNLMVKLSLPRGIYGEVRHFAVEVRLYGEVDLLDKILSIPNPPVFGVVGAAGGIKVSSKPSCRNIWFSLEGYAEIFAGIGLDLLPGLLPKIWIDKISLRAGAYIKKTKGYHSYHDHSQRRRCGCGLRRRWLGGDWSSRRRALWRATWHRATCGVVLYAKTTIRRDVVKAWLLIEYYVVDGRFLVTLGSDYYEIWKTFFGSWVTFASYRVFDRPR